MATFVATSRPRVLFLAALVIGLEAVAAVVFAVVAVADLDPRRLVVGVGVAVVMLGYGAFLVAVSRGVAHGRRWSRSAAVATQLLQGLLAYSFASGDTWAVALGLGTLAATALVCIFTPPATAVFEGHSLPGED